MLTYPRIGSVRDLATARRLDPPRGVLLGRLGHWNWSETKSCRVSLPSSRAELAATAPGDTVRRKEWHIRRVRKRMAEVDRRLTTEVR